MLLPLSFAAIFRCCFSLLLRFATDAVMLFIDAITLLLMLLLTMPLFRRFSPYLI